MARDLIDVDRRRSFHPPYDYDLALCEIMENRWDEAMGAAMRGLAGNPYIAELLLNSRNQWEMLLGCREGSRDIGSAQHYQLHYQWQWTRTPNALRFLRWVQTHPATLAATAPLRAYDHAAATTDDDDEAERLTRQFVNELDEVRTAARAAMRAHAEEGTPRPWELIERKTGTVW